MSTARYWLVKVPDNPHVRYVADWLLEQHGAGGVEVVEIIPDKRGANWMERELAEGLTKEITP